MGKAIIIAEAGVNHNGDYRLAKELVLAAKEAGADYVKFQTARPELVISKYAPKAEYQLGTTHKEESQLDMCRAIHLPLTDYKPLKDFCDETGIKFLSTPFDLESIDVLEELDMDYYKIPSGEITNLPYLQKISRLGRPVILSTGMSGLGDIEAALNVLIDGGLIREKIILLHCNTEYPTPYEDVNLRAMQTLARCFGVKVGYSDHTCGIEVPLAAVAMGACVIEKHFTLDKKLPGPDHKASLEPEELKQMVLSIRNIERALGSTIKEVSPSERKNQPIARKSLIAAKNIFAGEIFTAENMTVKRPGNGISPMRWYEVIGKTAPRDFKEDELIEI
ncbi:N-acetylneuraminate synthase [Coprobacter tertius]|uniref:N-acetylneuraminate synthase n=1 Tax=Coprobacter tertius TaxID=2944915 RepID=A0ABT1MEW9_9BACT|nr:N-acetylneuraminate synthase [Coprobacter tertius]MCP9610599.1 N-acetylneuraminate synthase [Coprobacter tertius]